MHIRASRNDFAIIHSRKRTRGYALAPPPPIRTPDWTIHFHTVVPERMYINDRREFKILSKRSDRESWRVSRWNEPWTRETLLVTGMDTHFFDTTDCKLNGGKQMTGKLYFSIFYRVITIVFFFVFPSFRCFSVSELQTLSLSLCPRFISTSV